MYNAIPKSIGNITPVSEASAKRSAVNQGKSETLVSDVNKNVRGLDLSGKDKSVKPSRHGLSIPSRYNASPVPKSIGNVTPRSGVNQGDSETPVSVSDMSKNVSVLDLSGEEKSAKPPRRHRSVPSKYKASPVPKSIGNITPVSEASANRSAVNQGKNDTFVSDIKLSESAANHLISLGFFKLALEAGCKNCLRVIRFLETLSSHRFLKSDPQFPTEVPLKSPSKEEALQENKDNKAAPEMEEISLTEVDTKNTLQSSKVGISRCSVVVSENGSKKYGGVMLWSKYYDDQTGYSAAIKSHV
ncbi:hypothetical protein BUALT_Bualt10G0125400 [Buddleja alternifolia]|uniref:Uncharacterized protein n=1 Tax=Buddleja alternifolia TaxID=168488 RepID=A0AAV6WZM1_9LAMI|nr:hypothetical protein BUALT_Bualt10G0125400 [Buddleja alternifolia]